MPFGAEVPPDELVEPPEEEVDPPEDVVEPPDEDVDEVEPPDEEVELVLLVELPPELVEDGSVPAPGPGVGSVGLVVEPRSAPGLAKSSLSFAPPQAARTAIDEATAALMRRRGFMTVAKH